MVEISDDKEMIQAIIDYVYYYNNERIQNYNNIEKGLGYLTPIEFKQKEMNKISSPKDRRNPPL